MDAPVIDDVYDAQVATSHLARQARDELVRAAYRRYYREQIQNGTVKDPVLVHAVNMVGVQNFITTGPGRPKTSHTDWFITISPKDDIDLSAFWLALQKCTQKATLKGNGRYCLEQRSQDDQPVYGIHAHWVLRMDTPRSKSIVLQQVYQCLRKFLAATNYIQLDPILTPLQLSNTLAYVSGDKKNPDKMLKVAKDRVYRASIGLPDFVDY